MTRQHGVPVRPRQGLAEKRQAILSGARTVSGSAGFARAAVDDVAAEAGVSTRTLCNHFANKEQLFVTALLESAVLGLGLDLAMAPWDEADHFALVRQVIAEAHHLPESVVEVWQESGPRPVRAELTRRVGELMARGLLGAGDPERAAGHFFLLAFTEITERTRHGAIALPAAEVTAIVTAGVRTFLHGNRQGRVHPCPCTGVAGPSPESPGA